MEHLEQIQRVVDYIESHLADHLTLESIAKESGFSKWHFQMVFSSVVGETLKDYIRKRRLSLARLQLGQSEKRILEIALEAGFESQESFSRAFKVQFGQNPGECRKKGIQNVNVLSRPKITKEYLEHLYKGVNMKPHFITLNQKVIMGVSQNFISILSEDHNNEKVIPRLWTEYFKNQSQIKNRVSEVHFGVCFAPENEKSHPDECVYLAGTEVHSADVVPKGLSIKKIPAGRYAIFTHKGLLDKLPMTMKYIYGAWLPKSGEKLREAPDLELYDHRFKPDSEESEFDIYIPIQ